MNTSFGSIETAALKLAPEDRALLADHLLASLTQNNEIEDAWYAEASRRLAAIESGQVQTVPADVAIAMARQALAQINAVGQHTGRGGPEACGLARRD